MSKDQSSKSVVPGKAVKVVSKPGTRQVFQRSLGSKIAEIASSKNISPTHQKLLERQQALLKTLNQPVVRNVAGSAIQKVKVSTARKIAKNVGIWSADGKLTNTYKK